MVLLFLRTSGGGNLPRGRSFLLATTVRSHCAQVTPHYCRARRASQFGRSDDLNDDMEMRRNDAFGCILSTLSSPFMNELPVYRVYQRSVSKTGLSECIERLFLLCVRMVCELRAPIIFR
jgi:hypothetical protein